MGEIGKQHQKDKAEEINLSATITIIIVLIIFGFYAWDHATTHSRIGVVGGSYENTKVRLVWTDEKTKQEECLAFLPGKAPVKCSALSPEVLNTYLLINGKPSNVFPKFGGRYD